jgi:hypothetical protein
MKRGACGNVMHGLTAICHEAGNGGYNGSRLTYTCARRKSIPTGAAGKAAIQRV